MYQLSKASVVPIRKKIARTDNNYYYNLVLKPDTTGSKSYHNYLVPPRATSFNC